ncbi:hypothetical protein [Streptomyces anulatus]|uniref:hypothetical protein n=1 Tax=Streptomyces anulatus TaxID=1892 RepID=UPI00343506DF
MYVELIGGPLDGQLLNVTSYTPEERADGALLISNHGAHGLGGRSDYPGPATPTGGTGRAGHWFSLCCFRAR